MKPVLPVIPGKELPVTEFAKYQREYITLPSYKSKDGMVTTRWELTWKERLQILFSGNIWLQVMAFHTPLQPVKLSTEVPEI